MDSTGAKAREEIERITAECDRLRALLPANEEKVAEMEQLLQDRDAQMKLMQLEMEVHLASRHLHRESYPLCAGV